MLHSVTHLGTLHEDRLQPVCSWERLAGRGEGLFGQGPPFQELMQGAVTSVLIFALGS